MPVGNFLFLRSSCQLRRNNSGNNIIMLHQVQYQGTHILTVPGTWYSTPLFHLDSESLKILYRESI